METSSEWLRRVQQESVERLEAVQRMQQQLAVTVGRAETRSGDVRVAVNPAGALVELELEASALRQEPDQLAASILALAAEATRRATQSMAEVVTPVLGTDRVADLLAGQVAQPTRAAVDDELAAARERGWAR